MGRRTRGAITERNEMSGADRLSGEPEDDEVMRITYADLKEMVYGALACVKYEGLPEEDALATVVRAQMGPEPETMRHLASLTDEALVTEYEMIFYDFENGFERSRGQSRLLRLAEAEINLRGLSVKRKASVARRSQAKGRPGSPVRQG